MERLLATSSNFSPFSRRAITFSANGSVATRMLRAWYSSLGIWPTCVSYSARSSCSVGFRSFRYFSCTACSSTCMRASCIV